MRLPTQAAVPPAAAEPVAVPVPSSATSASDQGSPSEAAARRGGCDGPRPPGEPSDGTLGRLRRAFARLRADLADPAVWQRAAALALMSSARSDLLLIHQARDIDDIDPQPRRSPAPSRDA